MDKFALGIVDRMTDNDWIFLYLVYIDNLIKIEIEMFNIVENQGFFLRKSSLNVIFFDG